MCGNYRVIDKVFSSDIFWEYHSLILNNNAPYLCFKKSLLPFLFLKI